MTRGVACAGTVDLLSAFATIDPRNHTHVRTALWAKGAVYAGVLSHEAQESEAVWSDLTSSVVGGHYVLVVAVDNDGPTCVTWGELRRKTWAWWDACAKEAYALLSPRWLEAGRIRRGFLWRRCWQRCRQWPSDRFLTWPMPREAGCEWGPSHHDTIGTP